MNSLSQPAMLGWKQNERDSSECPEERHPESRKLQRALVPWPVEQTSEALTGTRNWQVGRRSLCRSGIPVWRNMPQGPQAP